MIFFSWPRATLAICVSILAMQRAYAQTVQPTTNTSSLNSTTQFSMTTIIDMNSVHYPLIPLTGQAGTQGSLQTLQTIKPNGPLVLTNTSSVRNLIPSSIAYLSCEPGDYANGAMDVAQTIRSAAAKSPAAIVFYSVSSPQCSFSPANGFNYQLLYSMIAANDSKSVLQGLLDNKPSTPNTSIAVDPNTYNGSGSGQGNDNGAGGNVLGKSPTTAVAMIILYSITGIITALFLAIIVVGAIRAHRHPERYGPRRVMGRPRQSRARGIARAMLETLPIVKFGDKEDDKPAETGRDVELANTIQSNGTTNAQEPGEHSTDHAETANVPAADVPEVVTTVAAADTAHTHGDTSDPASAADNGLACSVCTDDFVKGQDIRVLPCKHKFHPECIDPWLLNVSGTCPLCRVDLHPTTSHDSDADGQEYYDGPSLETRDWEGREIPQVAESARGNRRSRILHTLNIGRMRHATPEERIAALRRLRSENEASDSFAEQGGSVGNTFSRRISRAFGGSRGGSRRASGVLTSRPVSEVPHNAAEPAAPTMTNMGPPIAEVTSHGTVEPSPVAEVTSPEGVSHPTAEATDSTATETDGTPQPATQTETETSPGATPHIGSETEHHNSESTAAEGTSPETNAR